MYNILSIILQKKPLIILSDAYLQSSVRLDITKNKFVLNELNV